MSPGKRKKKRGGSFLPSQHNPPSSKKNVFFIFATTQCFISFSQCIPQKSPAYTHLEMCTPITLLIFSILSHHHHPPLPPSGTPLTPIIFTTSCQDVNMVVHTHTHTHTHTHRHPDTHSFHTHMLSYFELHPFLLEGWPLSKIASCTNNSPLKKHMEGTWAVSPPPNHTPQHFFSNSRLPFKSFHNLTKF